MHSMISRHSAGLSRAFRSLLFVAAAGLLIAACTYRGGIDSPQTIKVTWFSYLNGDDIRQSCTEDSRYRARLVYNGRYNEQLRTYEITADRQGRALFVARAMGSNEVSNIFLGDPLEIWGWRRSETRLSEDQFIALERAFQESEVYRWAPDGLRLESDLFYWVAITCRDGQVSFNAWQHPSDRYRQIAFRDKLLALDETGVRFNPPRTIDPMYREKRQHRNYRAGNISGPYFELVVRDGELANTVAMF